MSRRKVVVDHGLCEANAICMGINPQVFHVDDDDHLHILRPEITAETENDVQQAVRRCPRQALSIVDDGSD